MKLNTIYQYFILLHCAAFIICENYYTVIAPGLLKSNHNYTVLVTLHQSNTPCTVRVSILGRSFNASDEVELQPLESKNMVFFPPKLDEGDYQLLAEGVSGCNFRNQSKIFINSLAGPKIYIQTDKSVYKPLDLVQFRVVILDEHTRPVNIKEPIRVEIYDSRNNRVKQFKDITLTKGVYTGKFQLSQDLEMGTWEIRTIISGKYSYEKSKTLSVLKYTLPKFSVYMETPENLVLNDAHIRAEIYGKYTFDKYVEGILTVTLITYDKNEIIEEKTIEIDGLVVVDFQLQNSPKLEGVTFLRIQAILEEKHTGIRRNTTQSIAVRKESYKIIIPDVDIEFRNNKPFRLKAYIKEWNGGPVWDSKTPVTMQHGNKKYETYLNEKGVAIFEFDYQLNASYTVFFKDSKQVLPSIFVAERSDDVLYCQLTLKENPRLGRPVQVEVRSSFNIPYLVYTVVGHATIVRMQHIQLSGNKKTHTIEIMPSVEMIPESFLYVHYVLDGNLRYEEIVMKFPPDLENQITVTAPTQVKPGEEVTLKVNAEPKSYVSILAVDISVYLLDNKYDIYKETIINDLRNDRSYVPESYIIKPGLISGLITLTNAHYPIYKQWIGPVSPIAIGPLDFRTKFPETWIFQNYEINNTDTEIVLNIPETITTWRITAFSNHPVKGFGVVNGPTDITTFLPFFITLNLPYSVKREEVITIPVTIFNYHDQSLETEIKMFNHNSEFHFMKSLPQNSSEHQQIKTTHIPANSGKTVKFFIKPLILGELELRIAANNSIYTDGIVQKLRVEPEGITKYQNKARYLSSTEQQTSLSLEIPLDSVSDSEFITLSVGGDFMIPTLGNLRDMVKMPTGCGEQNMVNFAPNVLILDYLKATGKYAKEPKLVNEAKSYIDIGYQQELSYRHRSGGGYSVFGEKYGEESSNWLTAYVVRFFIKASKYTAIEPRIIESDLEYLSQQQLYDGSFPYTGYLFYTNLQNKYGFTAFVLQTFMEDRKYSRKYQTIIQKGLEYITSDLDNINDIYALSIVATAMTKAKHQSTDKVIQKLQNLGKLEKDDLIWWRGNGNDVETTAYVLMALLNVPGNHLPILKWLIEQRNEQGGFKSTHDTVVGLEALVKYSEKYKNSNKWDLKVLYSAQDREGNEVKINEFSISKDNALTLQQHELPKSVRRVNFEIKGSGYSLVQLSSHYNVKNDDERKHFIMKTNPTIYDEEMDLEICFTYQAPPTLSNSTNMVIMEANLPSGFKTPAEFNRDLIENEFIQRIETKNDESSMILYFDKLSTEVRHCVNIEAFKANEVDERKPAAIVMYDYYNTSQSNSVFYEIL